MVVAGASTHPGKFGFVASTTSSPPATQGEVFATNREGAEVLGVETVADVDDLPDGAADLVFVCTPAAANPDLLRACAAKGITRRVRHLRRLRRGGRGGRRGPGRAGRAGRRARHPARRPERPGRRLDAGRRCAPRSWRRTRRAGRIGIASQSGNFVSSFMNYAVHTGVGVSRAVSRRQRRRGRRAPTTSTTTPTTPRPRSASPTSRASPTAGRSSTGCAASPSASRVVLVKGGATRRRPAGRGQPHRLARHRRPRLRRRVPPGRRHPGRHRRGGVRGGGHLRHPAAARAGHGSWS